MTDQAEARGDAGQIRRPVTAGVRVLVTSAVGLFAFGIVMTLAPWQVASLVGWDVWAGVFVGWVWWSIGRMDGSATAKSAMIEDDSRAASDVVLIAASVASLLGVGFALLKASSETGTARGLVTAVAALSVVLSWAAVHTVFTLRYARTYYAEGGGIDFNGDRPPDYRDFGYVAFTIGMTYQVSDTDLTSNSLRRTALRHALLSYLFGIVVVAITINVVAGLLRG
jgi:uncharacterized membrane protein